MDDAWDVLSAAFPQDWREAAKDTGALTGLRKDKRVDYLLRTLLLHTGLGYSLRITAREAKWAHLAHLSDVALRNRVKKSEGWLHELCVRLFKEQRLAVLPEGASHVRAVDAATVKEPEPSGSQWRVHYSVSLPSLACDFFKLTKPEGPGTGKSLARFPIRAGDHVLAGRGFATALGIRHVADAGGRAADCACRYRVAAAVHGGRAAVRSVGGGDVRHTCGRRPVLGDRGRGPGR